jgi:hypothetical protein
MQNLSKIRIRNLEEYAHEHGYHDFNITSLPDDVTFEDAMIYIDKQLHARDEKLLLVQEGFDLTRT